MGAKYAGGDADTMSTSSCAHLQSEQGIMRTGCSQGSIDKGFWYQCRELQNVCMLIIYSGCHES